MSDAQQTLDDLRGDNLSVKMFGAVGDGIVGAGTIAAGGSTFTATAGLFTPDHVGKTLSIANAGALVSAGPPITHAPWTALIATFISPTQVTISAPAVSAVTGSAAVWGTVDTGRLQSALDWCAFRGSARAGVGAITANTTGLVLSAAGFTASDVGSLIRIDGAGVGGSAFVAAIAVFTDSTHVTLSAPVVTTVAASTLLWGQPGPLSHLRVPHSVGVYMSGTLTVWSNICVEGGGQIDLLDDGTLTGQSILIENVSEVCFRDITVTSTNAGSRTAFYGSFRLDGASGVTIRGCTITGGASTAIHSINSRRLLISENSISETWADGIHLSRGTSQVVISNNRITHTGDDGIGLISYISDGTTTFPPMQDISVTGNNIYNLTKLVGRGIVSEGVTNLTVSGNSIDTVFDAGILIAGELGTNPSIATHFGHHIVISNNVIRNPGQGVAALRFGMFIAYCRSVVISANTILNCPADGISLSFVCKDVKVTKNDISICGGRGIIAQQLAQNDARLILELWTNLGDTAGATVGISNVQIEDNTIRNITANSISLEGETALHSPGCMVRGNTIYQGGADGILAVFFDGILISSNAIIGPGDKGISIGSLSYAVIQGNVVTQAVSYGIGSIIANHCIFIGNTVTACGAGGIFSDLNSFQNFITGNFTVGNAVFQVSVDNSVSNTSASFNNFGDDYLPAAQPYWQTTVNFVNGVNVQGIPDYAGAGPPGAGIGATGSTYRDKTSGDFWNKLVAGWQLTTNFFFTVAHGIRTNLLIGIGKDADADASLATSGDIRDGGLTASRPVLTDATKLLVSLLIDLANANHVKATGVTNGQILKLAAGVVAGVTGVSVNLTEITSGPTSASAIQTVALSGTVPPGLTLTTTTHNFIDGFGVATHTSVGGVVVT